MVHGMPRRRHLFDNGYPVCTGTRLLGSTVLLAVSNAALRSSRRRLAICLLRLADSSGRIAASAARTGGSHLALRDSRDNFSRLLNHALSTRAHTAVEKRAGDEPDKRPACEAPHRE